MQDLLQKTPQNCTTFFNLKRSNPINKLIFWVKNFYKKSKKIEGIICNIDDDFEAKKRDDFEAKKRAKEIRKFFEQDHKKIF